MKLKSIIWYLKRPQFIPQAWRIIIGQRLDRSQAQNREIATSWCWQKQITTEQAFHTLYPAARYLLFDQEQAQYYRQAWQAANNCAVKMGGAGNLDLLYNLVLAARPHKILETGVAYGWSSLAILTAIERNQQGRLISTDMPYLHLNNEPYVGCVIPQELRANWLLLRETDITGLPKALKIFEDTIDLCHYDSDKSYSGRMWAYPRLWEALQPGGIFVSDDIQDNLAFQEFSERLGISPLVIRYHNKFVGLLQKPAKPTDL